MAEPVEVSGWGRTPRSVSYVRQLQPAEPIEFDSEARSHLARGLGRSYGDGALNAGGVVWDTTSLTHLALDTAQGVARVGAGVSYEQLVDTSVPHGWFPPVTPGTKHVTIGGAVAADVHGKNHHRDGSLRAHVLNLTILTGDGEQRVISPGHELFEATFGGMGLTGVVLEAAIRLIPISSPTMDVHTMRTDDLHSTIETLRAADGTHRYTVAWLDLASTGARMGRGIVSAGNHSQTSSTVPGWHTASAKVSAPNMLPSGLVNRRTVKLFNQAWYRRAPRHGIAQESIESFFYPLDAIDNWNRLYGRQGFLQYQFVVPESAIDVLSQTIRLLGSDGHPLALAVLKRFGPGAGLLSFPMPGWTLAIDMPARRGPLAEVLDRVDRMVAKAGGRVYLAKDGRMRRENFRSMYPELDKWRSIADTYDPERRFRSDMDRRLALRSD